MAKRASASSSSGQPSQPKRPCLAPTGSERNLVLGSCSTEEEDVQRVATQMFFEHGTVGSGLSSTSGHTSGICFSSPHSDLQHDRRSQCSPFISPTSMIRTYTPPVGFPHTEVQPTALTDIPKESKDGPWDANPLQDFLIYSENVPSQNCQVESSGGVMGCEDQFTISDLQWAGQFILDDEALDPDWSKILVDGDATDPSKWGKEPERAKSHSAEYCQSCTGNALKDIVRWMHSMENSIPKLVREELERAKLEWAEYLQSCVRNALKDIVPQICLENDFHRLKEAVEPANSHSPHLGRGNFKSTANNGVRNLLLQLQTKLSLPIFTGKKIEGKEGARIYVALIDANTGDAVTSGPESSIKLDVVVLEGDFNKDNQDNWAQEEFEKYVAKERAGKGLLLTGDLVVTLKGGVGELGDLIFTDNSSWNRSKRFRIGLKVASGYCGNTRIQEAVTDAFRVKEHRGELYKKHYPPASDDEVWRLEKIAKDGKSLHKLSDAGIHKVEDFLLQLFTDPKKLKEILGKSITSASWDILVNHAMTCKTNWELYLYYLDGARKHGAVFNTDSQLIGLIKDRVYFATQRLSSQEREHGDTIVKKALDNWNDVREFNGETFSSSMQKKRSSSFPSQVFEEQVENLPPLQRNLAPPFCVTPVGLEAPLASAISNAEGHNGATALALPIPLQNTNSGNAMKLSVDESVCLAALQPISTDRLNVLIPQGDNGIPTVGLPIQSHGNNFQYAMRSHTIHSSSQMDYTVNENAPPSEPPSAAISRFQSSGTLTPSEGNHMMEDLQPFVSDDMDYLLALLSQSPPHDGGSVRGTSKGVHGWIKLKAVMKWGIFVRKIATTRRVGIVQLDELPIVVQA